MQLSSVTMNLPSVTVMLYTIPFLEVDTFTMYLYP